MSARQTSATPTSCQSPIATSGRPIATSPTRNAGLSRFAPVSDSAATRSDERADADRRVQVADAAVAEVEQLDAQ